MTSRRRRKSARKARDLGMENSRAQRLSAALGEGKAVVDRPTWPELITEPLGTETPTAAPRDVLGSAYIAAIAENRDFRPAWYGGDPHWDEPQRLDVRKFGFTSGPPISSMVLPEWLSLPLVRRVMNDDQLRKQFENSIRPE